MAFWQKLWGNDLVKTAESSEWQEIVLENEIKPAVSSNINKRTMEAFSGRMNPLEAQQILAEYTEDGWEKIASQVKSMALGKIYTTPWALGEIFNRFPQESADLLWADFQNLPIKNGLMLLGASGKGRDDEVTLLVSSKINALDDDDLSCALRILAKYPTVEAKRILASYLSHDNWKIIMKAATGLAESQDKEYLPQIKEAASQGGILGAGLQEIIKRME